MVTGQESFPTCMVILAVFSGTQCRLSSPQQPEQRDRRTQDGLNMYATSSGYSSIISTSFSIGRQ